MILDSDRSISGQLIPNRSAKSVTVQKSVKTEQNSLPTVQKSVTIV